MSCRRDLILDRIRGRVVLEHRVEGMTPCWIWTGPTSGNSHGRVYPRMQLDGSTCAAHRVAWVTVNGYLPNKKQLDHTCRQRLCVNPDHLEPVTHRENCRRRDEAGGSRS